VQEQSQQKSTMSEATLNDFMLGAYEMIDDPELEDSWSLDKNLRMAEY
jgi:hypothetical protein